MLLILKDASELPALPHNQSVQQPSEDTTGMIDHRQLFEAEKLRRKKVESSVCFTDVEAARITSATSGYATAARCSKAAARGYYSQADEHHERFVNEQRWGVEQQRCCLKN